jgi:hypothetical protein
LITVMLILMLRSTAVEETDQAHVLVPLSTHRPHHIQHTPPPTLSGGVDGDGWLGALATIALQWALRGGARWLA